MNIRLSLWNPQNSNLHWIVLERLAIWFYRGKPVAFGHTNGSIRLISNHWSDSDGSSVMREMTRLTEGGAYACVDEEEFIRQFDRQVTPVLKQLLSGGAAPVAPSSPRAFTKAKSVSVKRDREGVVTAVAELEHSPDGVTFLNGTATDTVIMEDSEWVDEDIINAAEEARAKLCSRLREAGVTIDGSVERAARINI